MAKSKAKTVHQFVDEWTRNAKVDLDWLGKLQLLDLLAEELYSQYQPHPESPDFVERLSNWLNNVGRKPQKQLLFELAFWLLFVGTEEMSTLYRASFRDQITRWVIDQARIDITAPSVERQLEDAFKKTFFGSIAGMDIGSFCRINGIQQSIRPDFREHAIIGDPKALRKHLAKYNYERIVAVEDYVGSGEQMKKACTYLAQLKSFPVLLCPLIIAPNGIVVGQSLASGNISFSPCFRIPKSSVVSEIKDPQVHEPPVFAKFRKLLDKTYSQVQGQHPTQPLYGPFGFPSTFGTGSLLLTYLNCPDNVPPAIHHSSESWSPLFRRSSREG